LDIIFFYNSFTHPCTAVAKALLAETGTSYYKGDVRSGVIPLDDLLPGFMTTFEDKEASPPPVLSQKRRNPQTLDPAIGADGRAASRREIITVRGQSYVSRLPPVASGVHHWLAVPTTG
jgi:hypothetical protein